MEYLLGPNGNLKQLPPAADFQARLHEVKRTLESLESGRGDVVVGYTERLLRSAIGDLDFDWDYFLRTGETSPEGWAKAA